jgi:hypothetical protein
MVQWLLLTTAHVEWITPNFGKFGDLNTQCHRNRLSQKIRPKLIMLNYNGTPGNPSLVPRLPHVFNVARRKNIREPGDEAKGMYHRFNYHVLCDYS